MKRALLSTILALWTAPVLADVNIFPIEPTAADPIEIFVSWSCTCSLTFDPPRLADDNRIVLSATANYSIDPPIVVTHLERFVLDPLPAGIYKADVEIDGEVESSRGFLVGVANLELSFHNGGILASARWRNPAGPAEGQAMPISLTPESGYFYFFDWKNAELTIKILDGRPVNGHYWVFISSMTTLEAEILVTNCHLFSPPVPCTTKTYVQPAGQNRNFVDTFTF